MLVHIYHVWLFSVFHITFRSGIFYYLQHDNSVTKCFLKFFGDTGMYFALVSSTAGGLDGASDQEGTKPETPTLRNGFIKVAAGETLGPTRSTSKPVSLDTEKVYITYKV